MLNRALKFSSGAGRLAARSPRLASSSPAAARAMSTWSDTKNLSMQVEDDGIAVFTLDMEGEPVNTLSSSLMGDFESMLNAVESDPKIKAAIIVSGKKSGWMAGADIKELAACKTAAEAENLSKMGQAALAKLSASKKPFVAAIDGPALGGGLEFALACHHRICTSSKGTQLGLVEMGIGLLPGGGGTQRMPALVGIQESLKAMTTAARLRPDKAKKIGLVSTVADPNALMEAARVAARGLADGSIKPNVAKKKNMMNKLLEDNPIGRNILFGQARKAAQKATGGNYPAVPAIIDCVEAGANNGYKAYDVESKKFGELSETSVHSAMLGMFNGMTALKKNRFGKPAKPAETVGVLGAGLMGAGVAQVTAQKAKDRVLLKDLNQAGLSRGIQQVEGNLATALKRRKMDMFTKNTTMSRIVGLTEDDPTWPKQFEKCDLVVEAVLEELSLKHRVIEQVEQYLPEHAIFATNTSALPIRDVAKASKRPENVLGMHYFSPVDKMPLLEIIRHEGTSDEACAVAVDLGIRQGKTVIVVGDVPGFYVNRCLGPYMAEVFALLTEGVEIEKMNKTMTSFGFPVGPIKLADEVGLDVAKHVNETLAGDLGVRMTGSDKGVAVLDAMMAKGWFGKKSGKGFFDYEKDKKGKNVNAEAEALLKEHMQPGFPKKEGDKVLTHSDEEIQNRCAASFINEAAYCLQDGIIENAVDGDIGAMFGIGFPPFRGGPFKYLDNYEGGVSAYVDMMYKLRDTHGEKFEPAQILKDHAKEGKLFHPEA